jgi:hypothetical protein
MTPIESGAVITFLLALFAGLRKFDGLKEERKVLLARIAKLEGEVNKIEDDKNDTLNRIRDYYDAKAKGHQDQLDEALEMKNGFHGLANFFVAELERIDPGWFERRRKEGGRIP